jgi:hypothetical protein
MKSINVIALADVPPTAAMLQERARRDAAALIETLILKSVPVSCGSLQQANPFPINQARRENTARQ